MANWASPKERFVEVPGVVEIRWVSDDPDYYVRPFDLFDQQATNEGLPDWYGKKDKATTEQAYFTCNVCECDLKSVVTLRAHCKGTQHIRKALQKKKEYRDSQKLLKKQQEGTKTEETTEDCKTLFECLEQTSEPAVGLENITEYKSTKSSTPYYHCNLEGCFNEQGDCHQMNRHIMVFSRHKQSWLRSKIGVAPQHSSEINQKIAEYTKDYKRDYRLIKIVEDDDLWKKCKKSQIRAPRVDREKEEPDEKGNLCREKRDSWEKERKGRGRDDRERSSRGRDDRSTWDRERMSRGRDENRNCDTEERRDRNSRPREERRSWKREGSYENGDSKRKRSRSRERSSRPNYRSRSREREKSSERWNGREVKVDREAVELDRPRSRDDYRDDHRKRSRYSEERERDRRGDVDRNREVDRIRKHEDGLERTRQDLQVEEDHRISKRERDDREDGQVRNSSLVHETASSSNQPRNAEATQLQYPEKSQEDEIQHLHRKVADCVKKRLNMYWAHIETTEPKNRKINDAGEYTKLAKHFSHTMRDQIKETYEQYERTLEGITLTADNREQIKTAIDMHFDSKPVIKLEGYRR